MYTTTLPFQVGDPVEHRGVVVAPLFPLRDQRARYVTLDAALDRGLSITETSEAGDVPELAVSNLSRTTFSSTTVPRSSGPSRTGSST